MATKRDINGVSMSITHNLVSYTTFCSIFHNNKKEKDKTAMVEHIKFSNERPSKNKHFKLFF